MPVTNRVSSVTSDRVTAVRVLHARRGRRKAGRFLVEGPQAIRSALTAGVPVHDLFVAEDAGGPVSEVVAAAQAAHVPVTWVTGPVMSAMSETRQPQGVIAICTVLGSAGGDASRLEAVMAAPGPVIVLEALADPGNVGTVIRTADAAGAAGVILTPEAADIHNGKVVRSTAGSLFHLPVLPDQPLADVIERARAYGRVVAVAAGDADADLFTAVDAGAVSPSTCWIVGSEAHGASRQAREAADIVVAIPMRGRAESLNAAIAAAVVLYVTAHAHKADWGPGGLG